MIVPFSELKTFVSDFECIYIPTFLNDLNRDENFDRGMLIVETKNKTGYVLISDGVPLLARVLAFSGDEQLVDWLPFDSLLSDGLCDLYLVTIDNDIVFKSLSDFFVYPQALYSPFFCTDVPKFVTNIYDRKADALLCFKHGSVLNIASFENGNFKALSFFDSASRRYVLQRDAVQFGAYLSSLDISKPMLLFKIVSKDGLVSSFFSGNLGFLEKDPVSIESELYFSLFSMILKVFSRILPQNKVAELTEKLFSHLRGRYPNLYSKLAYSPETADVNWDSLFEERKFIDVPYRYGEYYRYLDQILMLFLKTANSLLNSAQKESMLFDLRAKIRDCESRNEEIAGIFDRIDKLLKITC